MLVLVIVANYCWIVDFFGSPFLFHASTVRVMDVLEFIIFSLFVHCLVLLFNTLSIFDVVLKVATSLLYVPKIQSGRYVLRT